MGKTRRVAERALKLADLSVNDEFALTLVWTPQDADAGSRLGRTWASYLDVYTAVRDEVLAMFTDDPAAPGGRLFAEVALEIGAAALDRLAPNEAYQRIAARRTSNGGGNHAA